VSYNANEFLGGNFIKAEDIKASGPQIFTIEAIGECEFDSKKKPGTKERKLELEFIDGKKLTLNKTNIQVLVDAYGANTDAWKARPVILAFDPSVMFGSKRVGGIRLRLPKTTAVAVGAEDNFPE
jgi:hypothetical protein